MMTDRPIKPARGWRAGLADSLPLVLGYFPIALSFGLMAGHHSLGIADALAVSGLVYAGAAQFALVGLVGAGGAPLVVGLTVGLINLRHLFYGPALLSRLGPGRPPNAVLALGMTDEVFAVATSHLDRRPDRGWLLGLQGGAYGAWLAGTLVGAALPRAATSHPAIDGALGFLLPALFLALLLDLLKGNRSAWPVPVAAAAIALGVSALLPGHAALLAALVGGAGLSAALAPRTDHGHAR